MNKIALCLLMMFACCMLSVQEVRAEMEDVAGEGVADMDANGTITANDTAKTVVIQRASKSLGAVVDVCPSAEKYPAGHPQAGQDKWGFTQRIVTCIQAVVDAGTGQMIQRLYAFLYPAIMTFAILAVAVFGVSLALGSIDKPAGTTLIFMLKIGLLFTYMNGAVALYGVVLAGITQSMAWASSVMDTSPSFFCPQITAITSTTVWERIDCVLGSMLGAAPGMVIKMGLVGILFGFLFSGATGFMVFVIGIIFFATIIMSIARSVHIYLVSMIGVGLLMAMSPLFVPLVLMKQTKSFFDKWLKLVIALALQPIFLFMYLAMMLVTLDTLVYKAPTSFYGIIAGSKMACQARATPDCDNVGGKDYSCGGGDKRFCITSYMRAEGILTNQLKLGMVIDLSPPAGGAAPADRPSTGFLGRLWGSFTTTFKESIDAVASKLAEAASGLSIRVPVTLIDFQAMYASRGETKIDWPGGTQYDYLSTTSLPMQPYVDAAGKAGTMSPATQFSWTASYHLLLQMFLCALMGYVMYAILKHIPDLSHSMVGSIFNSPNLYQVSPVPFEKKGGELMHNISMQFLGSGSQAPTTSRRR